MSPTTPWQAMFAVGVFAGLRTGVVQALEWGDVDFETKLIHVSRSVEGPLKDNESRIVPLSPPLARVLQEWRKANPPRKKLCFPSMGHHGTFVKIHTAYKVLHAAQDACKITQLTWYESTRHTFGGHWVMKGGSLEKLRVILGHSTTEVTLRYAHMVPGQFTEGERDLVSASLWDADVIQLKKS